MHQEIGAQKYNLLLQETHKELNECSFPVQSIEYLFRRTHLQLPPWSTTALAVQAVVERKIVNSGWMSQIRVHVKTQSLREPLETLDVDARCWRKPSKHAYIDTYQNMVVRLEENTEVVIVS